MCSHATTKREPAKTEMMERTRMSARAGGREDEMNRRVRVGMIGMTFAELALVCWRFHVEERLRNAGPLRLLPSAIHP
jgi:hypothetical protein